MKHLLLALLAGFLVVLSGCLDTEHKVSGEVGVAVEYSTPWFNQINGINYFGYQSVNGTVCIALDPSALYSDVRETFQNQDLNRIAPYTQEELDNCL